MKYIFAVRKGGAIAHPDNYREVEQWTENPCVPVPIAIGTIPGAEILIGVEKSPEKFVCYVLYSKSIDSYYVGYTSDFEGRLRLHRSGYFGGKSYTCRATDWELFLLIPCQIIEQAVYIESRIKKMKSRQYIENLRKYPDLVERILQDYYN